MAITYKAGNRLIDHGRTPSYSTDFSTVVGLDNIASDNSDWTSTDSTNTNVANERIEATIDSSGDRIQYYVANSNADIKENTQVSDTKWVLRFSVEWTAKNANSGFYFGMDGTNNAISTSTTDSLGMYWEYTSSKRWGIHDTNGEVAEDKSAVDFQTLDPTVGEKYYFEVKRTSATSAEVSLYSDSNYNTFLQKSVDSLSGSNYGHRYIRFMARIDGESGSASTIKIDDVKLYDDNGKVNYSGSETPFVISSGEKPTADGTNENGTTLIEKNTGKEHMLNYGQWAETNQPSSNIAELLNDYSSVRKQHMWDWFTGSNFSNYASRGWTETDTGGGSSTMQDEVDGGLLVSSGTGTNNVREINFNTIHNFSPTGAGFIAIVKATPTSGNDASGFCGAGLKGGGNSLPSSYANISYFESHQGASNFRHAIGRSSSSPDEQIDTGVTRDTNWHLIKIENGASNSKLSIDGILRSSGAVSSGNVPNAKQQPFFCGHHGTSGNGATTVGIRYIEAYNT